MSLNVQTADVNLVIHTCILYLGAACKELISSYRNPILLFKQLFLIYKIILNVILHLDLILKRISPFSLLI